MIYYDSIEDTFYQRDENDTFSIHKHWREADEDAKDYYVENKERLNINLQNIPNIKITLESIMQYGLDPEKIKQIEVDKMREELASIDIKSIRSIRAFLNEAATEEDIEYLKELEAKARELRQELKKRTGAWNIN